MKTSTKSEQEQNDTNGKNGTHDFVLFRGIYFANRLPPVLTAIAFPPEGHMSRQERKEKGAFAKQGTNSGPQLPKARYIDT